MSNLLIVRCLLLAYTLAEKSVSLRGQIERSIASMALTHSAHAVTFCRYVLSRHVAIPPEKTSWYRRSEFASNAQKSPPLS